MQIRKTRLRKLKAHKIHSQTNYYSLLHNVSYKLYLKITLCITQTGSLKEWILKWLLIGMYKIFWHDDTVSWQYLILTLPLKHFLQCSFCKITATVVLLHLLYQHYYLFIVLPHNEKKQKQFYTKLYLHISCFSFASAVPSLVSPSWNISMYENMSKGPIVTLYNKLC